MSLSTVATVTQELSAEQCWTAEGDKRSCTLTDAVPPSD